MQFEDEIGNEGGKVPSTAFGPHDVVRNYAAQLASQKRYSDTMLKGGVSGGIYASLNGGVGSNDDAHHVRENRSRMAAAIGVATAIGGQEATADTWAGFLVVALTAYPVGRWQTPTLDDKVDCFNRMLRDAAEAASRAKSTSTGRLWLSARMATVSPGCSAQRRKDQRLYDCTGSRRDDSAQSSWRSSCSVAPLLVVRYNR